MIELTDFLADRKQALLSMDKATIAAYMTKYGVRPPTTDNTFGIAVHMARTGAKDLPTEERIKSKQWLSQRGCRSLDDGDLP